MSDLVEITEIKSELNQNDYQLFYNNNGDSLQSFDGFVLPPFFSFDPKPDLSIDQVADIVNSKWVINYDYRDRQIWLKSDSSKSQQVTDLGAIDPLYTLIKPDDDFSHFDEEQGAWLLDFKPYFADYKQKAHDTIDQAVLPLYDQFTKFKIEYDPRIMQARKWMADNTSTDLSFITPFATAARLSTKDACADIITQADNAEQALEILQANRMRKSEIGFFTTVEEVDGLVAQVLEDILGVEQYLM